MYQEKAWSIVPLVAVAVDVVLAAVVELVALAAVVLLVAVVPSVLLMPFAPFVLLLAVLMLLLVAFSMVATFFRMMCGLARLRMDPCSMPVKRVFLCSPVRWSSVRWSFLRAIC